MQTEACKESQDNQQSQEHTNQWSVFLSIQNEDK
jgi:hypothetical protein